MNWLNIFNKKKSHSNEEIILVIILREEKGESLLIKRGDSKFQLIEKQPFFYSNAFENLLEDIDQVVSGFEEKGYQEIIKVVYFLSSFFFDEKSQIKDLFLHKLKEINEKLELKPIGYIETKEAIIYQKEKENGLPLSVIFIEIEKTHFSFILRKAGKQIYEKIKPKTNNFLFDIYEIIDDIKKYYPLPIRIIIFNGSDLEEEKESLSGHLFKEEYFIQTPRVEIVTQEMMVKYFIDFIQSALFNEFFFEKNLTEENKDLKSFGFFINKDVKEINNNLHFQKSDQKKKDFSNLEKKVLNSKGSFIKEFLLKAKNLSVWFSNKVVGLIYFFKESHKKLLFSFLLVILGLFIFINEFFFHKIIIKLSLPKKELKKEITINEAEVNLINDRIEKSIEGTISTTGKKDIGEKARGEIEIYNYTFEKKTLNAGTILTTKEIDYILNDQVEVASASYIGNQIGNPIQPGKSRVLIVASRIGEEGNQPEGTIFIIKNFSQNELFAKSVQSIGGGYKKQVNIFSQSDKEKLQELVINKGKKSVGNTNRTDLILISSMTEAKIIDENYSNEVGDESREIVLRAKVSIHRYFLNKNKIKEFFINSINKDIPQEYVLDKKYINLLFKKIEENDNRKTFYFSSEGWIIKKINKEELKKSLIFIQKSDLKNKLKKYDIINYQIVEERNLIPLFYNYFPFFERNIEILFE